MADRAQANPKIKWQLNKHVVEVLGRTEGMRKFVTGAKLQDSTTGEITEIACDGIFVAIGHSPNTSVFTAQLEMDALGYIRTKGRSTFTNISGIFACGDCQDHVYRQAITAAGSSLMINACAAALWTRPISPEIWSGPCLSGTSTTLT